MPKATLGERILQERKSQRLCLTLRPSMLRGLDVFCEISKLSRTQAVENGIALLLGEYDRGSHQIVNRAVDTILRED